MKHLRPFVALHITWLLAFISFLVVKAEAQVNINLQPRKEYRSSGDISLLSRAPTATQLAGGTSPASGSKVTPGQIVTLQLVFEDIDQSRNPGGEWQDFKVPVSWGTYNIQLSLTNAVLKATNKTSDTFVAERLGDGTFDISDINITVDPNLTANELVSINIQVTDNVVIPDNLLAPGTAATACQDPTVAITTFTWSKATSIPTKAFADRQDPGAVGTEQKTDALSQWYLYVDNTYHTQPDFVGDTVDERFADPESNITKAWVNPTLVAQHPDYTDPDWVKFFFDNSEGVANAVGDTSTFTIGPDGHTTDNHTGRIFSGQDNSLLSNVGKQQSIYWTLPQAYQIPDGKNVATFDITRRRRGKTDGTATYTVQKQ